MTKVPLGTSEVNTISDVIDRDRNGKLDYNEFIDMLVEGGEVPEEA